ncbi:MAG: serine/threonine-protein kinase [Myxococcota bacterium]
MGFEDTTTFDGDDTPVADSTERPDVGDCVGRYVLLSELGTGGMGVVYEALDPELDRRVALKILHARYAGPGHAARLVREGQALARISHPNVVQVFETGHFRDTIYIVMELIEGESLARWFADGKPWAEVVGAFISAGRGLAAAHAEGLVHRDFKPGNVMIGTNGDVKVLDFGLARALGEPSGASVSGESTAIETGIEPASVPSGLLRTKLTRDGTVLGTPPYMAAEQFRGDRVDHRADQHAFCVSLYEGLYGRRPFAGDDWKALRRLVAEGDIGARPKSEIPRALWSIIRRGTRPEPGRRYSSMDELVRTLRNQLPTRRKNPVRTAAVGTAAFAGIAVWFGAVSDASSPCADAANLLADVWGDDQRDATISGFGQADVAYSEGVRDKVIDHLDHYAHSWAEQRAEVCSAIESGDDDSTHLLDRRMQCLSDSARHLAALANVLATPDAETVERAIGAVRDLPPLARCQDAATLLASVSLPEDPSTVDRIEMLRGQLAYVRAEKTAGRWEPAREKMSTILEDAKQVGYSPLVADALRLDGDLAADAGDYATAAEQLEAAYWAAVEAGDDRETAAAAVALASIVGSELDRRSDCETWLRHAEGAIERLDSAGVQAEDLRANVAVAYGVSLFDEGKLAESLVELKRGRALFVVSKGEEDLEVAAVDLTTASVLTGLGRFDEALETFERVLESYTAAFGDGHPRLALLHGAIANLHRMTGKSALAVEHAKAGLAIVDAAYDGNHPLAAKLQFNLGGAEEHRGNIDEAAVAFEAAAALAAKDGDAGNSTAAFAKAALAGIHRLRGNTEAARLGFEESARMFELTGQTAQLGSTLTNLGGVYGELERFDEALTTLERAEKLVAETRGEDNPGLAEVVVERGAVLIKAKRPKESVAALDEALAIALKTLEPGNELVLYIHRQLATAHLNAEQLDEALEHAKLAVNGTETTEVAGLYAAAAQLTLARVHGARGEKGEARKTARQALALLENQEDAAAEGLRRDLAALVGKPG